MDINNKRIKLDLLTKAVSCIQNLSPMAYFSTLCKNFNEEELATLTVNDFTVIHYCSYEPGGSKYLEQLLKIYPNISLESKDTEKTKRTALHIACAFGHKRTISILLNAGAKMDSTNTDGDVPLQEAKEYLSSDHYLRIKEIFEQEQSLREKVILSETHHQLEPKKLKIF